MPKVSAKHVQRRIADLDALPQPRRPRRIIRQALALIILALIAFAAFSYANRSRSDFTRLTLKQGTAPKGQMSDAHAKWNAIFRLSSSPASNLASEGDGHD